ncbi:MAG: hypothetical protein JXB85_12060 [Anaerolineales bacterium]|nr:hypothetical protein [Anaerolineales bacterium]
MKRLLALTLLVVLLAGCSPADSDPGLGAGFRYSTTGPGMNPGAEYWAAVGEAMAARFPGAAPQAVWIIGGVYGDGTYLNFPCQAEDPLIRCGYVDMNEAYLDLFDERGIQVWLQVESGHADMLETIDLVLDQYSHHASVIGFGVDVEWYQTPLGSQGVPISDAVAAAWVRAVQRHDRQYLLFLKHYEIAYLPPSYRDGIVFINDHQDFENFDALLANFTAWGQHFAPAPVGYQFGYPSDSPWWSQMQDPPGEIGAALLEAIPNTRTLLWVDFTVLRVFPPEEILP